MKFILLLLFTSLTFSSFSQMDSSKFTPPLLLRGIGVSFQQFDGLNSRIANRPEFKSLRDYAGIIELGWMQVHNRFISDIDLSAGSSMSGDRDRRSSTLRYLSAGIDFGYDLLANKRILLSPLVGVGSQAYQAKFYRDNAAVPFNAVLESPASQNDIRPVDFKNSFFTYRLGLGFAVQSPSHPGSSIGIVLRYTGSFKDKSWRSSYNQELADAPTDRLSQFQASLIMTNLPHMMR